MGKCSKTPIITINMLMRQMGPRPALAYVWDVWWSDILAVHLPLFRLTSRQGLANYNHNENFKAENIRKYQQTHKSGLGKRVGNKAHNWLH